MPFKALALVAAAACSTVLSVSGAPRSGPVEFRAHDIEPKFPGGYAVQAVDINKDGKLDVVVYSDRGGKWERNVILNGLTEGHEVAVADLNGDGKDDIVAGDRNARSPAVHVMYAPADSKPQTNTVLLA
jgi:hypothetical protein